MYNILRAYEFFMVRKTRKTRIKYSNVSLFVSKSIMSRTHRCFLSLSVRKDHIYTDARMVQHVNPHTHIHTHTHT